MNNNNYRCAIAGVVVEKLKLYPENYNSARNFQYLLRSQINEQFDAREYRRTMTHACSHAPLCYSNEHEYFVYRFHRGGTRDTHVKAGNVTSLIQRMIRTNHRPFVAKRWQNHLFQTLGGSERSS